MENKVVLNLVDVLDSVQNEVEKFQGFNRLLVEFQVWSMDRDVTIYAAVYLKEHQFSASEKTVEAILLSLKNKYEEYISGQSAQNKIIEFTATF